MLTNLPIAVAASACFGLSTVMFKHGVDTADQRFTMAAAAILFAGYGFYLQLLQGSMASAIVVTSMLSQVIALGAAFFVFKEAITTAKGIGIVLATSAIIAFSLPASAKF